MANQKKQPHHASKVKKPTNPYNFILGLIVLAYILIPTFAPNLMTLDTNGPKFLSLALLNLLVFIYLIFNPEFRNNTGYFKAFFNNKIGLAYTVFLFVCLLSFTNAINISESVIQFTKIFSVFSAVLFMSVILMRDIRNVKLIIIVVTGILIFDSLSVFYYINQYINGKIPGIIEIKSVYSNKNILASSIFVKMAFALWLFMFEKGWLKKLGLLALFMGFTATLFMATRGFYVGIVFGTIVFAAYTIIRYFRFREKKQLGSLATYLGALALAVVVFSATQRFYYPDRTSRFNQSVAGQLSTINTYDASTSLRIESWKWSLELLRQNPLLGVGAGNWKIEILRYENRQKPDYIYLYKAHNDFIETAAETGLIGGLLFLSLFVLIAINFLMVFFKGTPIDDIYKYLFLAASGMFFYSFDAFFNFPADRPEILLLFGLFIAIGIASSIIQKKQNIAEPHNIFGEQKKARRLIFSGLAVLFTILLMATSYIFFLNFKSLRLQRVIYQDLLGGKLQHPSSMFTKGFPFIPNISIWGESIEALKARYLIQDQKYDDAIRILMEDDSNPYDARREFFLATIYHKLSQPDSMLAYAKQSYELKPFHFSNLHMLLSVLETRQQDEAIKEYLERFLDKQKFNSQAWLFATSFLDKIGDSDRASQLIDSARLYLPGDTLIQQQQQFLHYRKFIGPNVHLFNTGSSLYHSGNYKLALKYFSDYIEVTPFDPNAYRMRAFCYYYLQDYKNCISDMDTIFMNIKPEPSLLNLRGVCHQALNNIEAACKDYTAAMRMGDKDGKINYDRYCLNRN